VCIPVTLWIQYVAYNTSVSRSVQLTLIPITFGVGYATIYDLEIRLVGLGDLRLSPLNQLLYKYYLIIYFFKFILSVRHVCCYCHCRSADIHKRVSKIIKLWRSSASISYRAIYFNRNAYNVSFLWQCYWTSQFPVYYSLYY